MGCEILIKKTAFEGLYIHIKGGPCLLSSHAFSSLLVIISPGIVCAHMPCSHWEVSAPMAPEPTSFFPVSCHLVEEKSVARMLSGETA